MIPAPAEKQHVSSGPGRAVYYSYMFYSHFMKKSRVGPGIKADLEMIELSIWLDLRLHFVHCGWFDLSVLFECFAFVDLAKSWKIKWKKWSHKIFLHLTIIMRCTSKLKIAIHLTPVANLRRHVGGPYSQCMITSNAKINWLLCRRFCRFCNC